MSGFRFRVGGSEGLRQQRLALRQLYRSAAQDSPALTMTGIIADRVGALLIRIGFWAHYTIIIIMNPPQKK